MASSCCLSFISSLPAKIHSPSSKGCCRLLSLHWLHLQGKRKQTFLCVISHQCRSFYISNWDILPVLGSDWSLLTNLTSFYILWFLSLQLSHTANHYEVSPGELWSWPANCAICASSGSHYQHGWNSPVWSSGSHLHSSSQWVWLGLGPAGHYQVRINTENRCSPEKFLVLKICFPNIFSSVSSV